MEIERKWLIDSNRIPYKLSELDSHTIEQFYISTNPTIRARKINDGEEYILTVKTTPGDRGAALIARNEYELPLNAEEYANLLRLCTGTIIRKTRYTIREEDGLLREIDIFRGQLEGLAFMEIEFPDIEAAMSFPSPEWIVRDVTEEREYKNGYLALHGMPRKTC